MALFLNGLAFPGPADADNLVAGKVGTLLGSLVSAAPGAGVLPYGAPAEPDRH